VGSDGKPDNENTIRLIYEPDSFTPLARYKKGQLHYAVMDTVGRIQELLTEDGTNNNCGAGKRVRMTPTSHADCVFRVSMRMKKPGCITTGSGTMIVRLGSI
jgi:hypothetical protein